MASVLVATNSANATEQGGSHLRVEYQVVNNAAKGNFDWAPTFGQNTAALLADLYSALEAVILARHGITVADDDIILLGGPSSTHA